MIKQPTFLVGAERSGTTMLRLMLSHHPELTWVNEFEYAVDRMPARDGWPNVDAYRAWLETHRVFQASGLSCNGAASYPELVNGFLEQWRARAGKPMIGATVHRHFDRVLCLWPDARFIHLVRDPRDVARSRIRMGWAGNVWVAAADWVRAERLWDAVCGMVPASRRCEVSYETLLADPENELRRLCAFLGVNYTHELLDYSKDTTYDPPDPSLCYQWRGKMSKRDVRLVEARAGELMRQRGYELSGEPAIRLSKLRRTGLNMQHRLYRARFRRQRYGTKLWLADGLARRLGWHDRWKHVRLKMNCIDEQYLK